MFLTKLVLENTNGFWNFLWKNVNTEVYNVFNCRFGTHDMEQLSTIIKCSKMEWSAFLEKVNSWYRKCSEARHVICLHWVRFLKFFSTLWMVSLPSNRATGSSWIWVLMRLKSLRYTWILLSKPRSTLQKGDNSGRRPNITNPRALAECLGKTKYPRQRAAGCDRMSGRQERMG